MDGGMKTRRRMPPVAVRLLYVPSAQGSNDFAFLLWAAQSAGF
jgi:hypothetical protein